jgi:hypothetical protein
MNVQRLSPLVVASLLLAAPAAAQCNYQSGTPQCFSFAPPLTEAGNISENLILRSDKLAITGDVRFRTRNADSPLDAPYARGDQLSTRARVNLDYKVDEHIRAFVQFNFSELWPGSDSYSDAVTDNDFNGVAQAYFLTDDLFGAGETLRIGRSYFTIASGLVYGSCDFLQYPAAGTGVWLSKRFGDHSLELFGFDNNGTLTAAANGARYVGATGRIGLGNEVVAALEPWALFGTGEGDVQSEDEWYGVAAYGGFGECERGQLFQWNGELAQRDVEATDESRTAYRVNFLTDLHGLTGGFVDRLRLTRTESEGAMHINPGDFNTAGLLHQYAGAWRSDLDTSQVGLSFQPHERITLDLAYLALDPAGVGGVTHEGNVMLGGKLREGAFAWLGYGRDDDDREVLYTQLTIFF